VSALPDIGIAANARVLAWLARHRPGPRTLERFDEVPNAYVGLGCHPDIVERLWTDLNTALPADCRCVLARTPALVHPATGLVLALGIGTQYALRIVATDRSAALAAGLETTTGWAGGQKLDLEAELGAEWLFGGWAKLETAWCCNSFDARST
jgi:hypothetical protein